MDIAKALEFIGSHPLGTLATLRADGSPHVSVVSAAVIGGELWISLTQDRIKTRNIRHDPRVSFLAGQRPWAAVDGRGRLIEDGPDLPGMLRTYYQAVSGEHPDWDEYDAAMVTDRRLILAVEPVRAYGFMV